MDITQVIEPLFRWLPDDPVLAPLLGTAVLVVIAVVVDYLTCLLLLASIRGLARRTTITWDDHLVEAHLFKRVAHLAPLAMVYVGLTLVPGWSDELVTTLQRLVSAVMVLCGVLAVGALLTAVNRIYDASNVADGRSIKTYIQLGRIFLYAVGAVLVVATALGRQPWVMLSGIGAMTAVLLLVFRDTILSFVASMQISSYDMVRVGDWIEMPTFGADGDVIDIGLHTVKVQNWNKTITTIPTHRLISESFRNWRGMSRSGGRRIKRCLWIDMNSIRFLDEDDLERLGRVAVLKDYLAEKREELAAWNAERPEAAEAPANARHLTNIGTFRAYLAHYLREHPSIHKGMTLLVRQLQPEANGLPIEIYAFTADTRWANYEGIQSDIFDHVLAILPEFGLRVFQAPSGRDLEALARPAGSPSPGGPDRP